MTNKIYAAGVTNSRGDWEFQGTVIAESFGEAKRLLAQFKKQHSINGRCEITTFGMRASHTKLGKGVSNSTDLS